MEVASNPFIVIGFTCCIILLSMVRFLIGLKLFQNMFRCQQILNWFESHIIFFTQLANSIVELQKIIKPGKNCFTSD
jgi:hypothetical protein